MKNILAKLILSAPGLLCFAWLAGGCGGGGGAEPRKSGPDKTARETATDGEPQHPSADQDGLVYYFANNYSREQGKTVQTRMLLYTAQNETRAKELMTRDGIQIHRKISRNMMGALLEEMQKARFFGWPQGKDQSQIKEYAYGSINQILVDWKGGSQVVVFTSDDYKSAGAETQGRIQKFNELRYTIFGFARHSDPVVETSVGGK